MPPALPEVLTQKDLLKIIGCLLGFHIDEIIRKGYNDSNNVFDYIDFPFFASCFHEQFN